jgi:predicted DsbA family dithiol-disulfide isomerase
MKDDPLRIEVTSDFVCPWCYLGEARLEKALKLAAPKMGISLKWRPYELNPNQPKEGVDRQEYMAKKFGLDRVQKMQAHMKELGQEEGLDFRQELIKRSPNTRQAHRLGWWAEKEGKSVARLIFKAYFSEGRDIGDDNVLIALAKEAGLDEKKTRACLSSGEGTDDVLKLEEQARARGIQGVPFITIDNEEIHGAETVEVMTRIIEKAIKLRKAA